LDSNKPARINFVQRGSWQKNSELRSAHCSTEKNGLTVHYSASAPQTEAGCISQRMPYRAAAYPRLLVPLHIMPQSSLQTLEVSVMPTYENTEVRVVEKGDTKPPQRSFSLYQHEIYLAGYKGILPCMTTNPSLWEDAGKQVMSPKAFAYVKGGAGQGETVRKNTNAFQKWSIIPPHGESQRQSLIEHQSLWRRLARTHCDCAHWR
jgi:hypothetical protein